VKETETQGETTAVIVIAIATTEDAATDIMTIATGDQGTEYLS
jgi:hypothetical protein